MSFEQVSLQFLLPLSERKHAVQALAVLGMKCAVVHLAQGVSVYRLCGNGVFPVPVVARFLVAAQPVQHEVPVTVLV